MRSIPTIAFDCRPSRSLTVALALGFALALCSILACGLDGSIKASLTILVSVYAWRSLRDFRNAPFDHAIWHAAGHWRLRAGENEAVVAELVSSKVLGVLLVLILRVGSKRTVALLLLPDNCDADTRRRLRVRLKRSTIED